MQSLVPDIVQRVARFGALPCHAKQSLQPVSGLLMPSRQSVAPSWPTACHVLQAAGTEPGGRHHSRRAFRTPAQVPVPPYRKQKSHILKALRQQRPPPHSNWTAKPRTV